MSDLSLYRRVLGERFKTLPSVLQRFHSQPRGGCAIGTFEVVRAKGMLRNLLANFVGLPPSGCSVHVELETTVLADRERWTRSFNGKKVVTYQWQSDDCIMEKSGLFSFSSVLVLEGRTLSYVFRRGYLLGVPLPGFLSPRVSGAVDAEEQSWLVLVSVNAPILGELVRYSGVVRPR
jgi:hypothetical protein